LRVVDRRAFDVPARIPWPRWLFRQLVRRPPAGQILEVSFRFCLVRQLALVKVVLFGRRRGKDGGVLLGDPLDLQQRLAHFERLHEGRGRKAQERSGDEAFEEGFARQMHLGRVL
jgi:hypothetical protein